MGGDGAALTVTATAEVGDYTGDVEGTVEGDIRAHQLTVGETATIRGEIAADEIIVNGRVVGRVRGLKVRSAIQAGGLHINHNQRLLSAE